MAVPLSRRTFLVAGGSALVVAACSSDKAAPPSTSSSTRPAWNLVGFFASDALAAGTLVRLPFGLAGADGGFPSTLPVDALTFTVRDTAGNPVALPVTVPAHADGLPRPYFPLEVTIPTAGIYTVHTDVQDTAVEATVQIGTGGTVPHAGQPMIPFDTPTASDPRGVQLLCTHDPVCPLHDVTLTEALAEQRPVAFLIATPKYCQVAVCGPVLDHLLAVRDEFPQVRFLHSEVYPSDAAAQPGAEQLDPVVQAYGLTYEPALFLAGADGTVRIRLDAIYDKSELRRALQALVS
jgi:hypothetical protein